jgi:hypothetical protein
MIGRVIGMKPDLTSVREDQPIVIPTLFRAKIPRNLSYPIGAEVVSECLLSVPQFFELKLVFFSSKFDVGVRSGRYERHEYEFLRVEYLNETNSGENWPISRLWGRPAQSRWEIVVQPVPRGLRYRIKKYIIESALASMNRWLVDRANLERRGRDVLAFFYDEGKEEFLPRTLSVLEPNRPRRIARRQSLQSDND